METNLSKYDNSWYRPGSKLKRLLWYFVNMFFFQTSWNISSSLKISLLRLFGAELGKGVVIKPKVNIKYAWNLKVGNHCWIGENVWIDNLAMVVLEDNVCISQGALLLCGNHNYKKSTFDLIIKPIALEKGSWVGAKCIVAPGVILKSHSVLTIGSVATKSLEPYTIYSGNPAQKLKFRKIDSIK
ncbi:WcaF family extracellular polysaccharide biosynthesis acetyltransferase [Winogradskyella flava]|uniref:WcaF family extracellular polysaccharide biosynthesis acetyltransferase n=1 Tax=Winogradskyella flava TaxID=1884876 RepID=UPI0024905EC4|nr:WcaF family extracellular polysaccharide biosynthesis acetyltransferase [Winogradskyella flava]